MKKYDYEAGLFDIPYICISQHIFLVLGGAGGWLASGMVVLSVFVLSLDSLC